MADAPFTPKTFPAGQRFEVLHSRLGPWAAGAVLQADVDLIGANVAALVDMRAVEPTDKPHDPRRREGA